MIIEHPDTPVARVADVVRRDWGVDVTEVEHVEAGVRGWHWVLHDDHGPQWFATMDVVRTVEERGARLAAFEAGARLAGRLGFVVAPVPSRDGRVAVDLAPGLLLTLMPHLDGVPYGSGPFRDDAERSVVASMMGDLHRQPRPRHLPVWQARIGSPRARHDDLDRLLAQEEWTGGPWSVPASRLVGDAGGVLRTALRRFALLAAAVAGTADRWVVTHGEPHTANLLRTPDGPRLVDWSTVALAPRERDLREVLGECEGDDPWYAYLEAGGRPEPLSPDTVELFALQWHLSGIAEQAVLFSGPHGDTADEQRCFGDLEEQVGALLARWA